MTEINDIHLLMYLDGLADKELATKIESDENHRQRADELSQQQKEWVSRMYRGTCPNTLMLGEYHLGVLHPTHQKSIEKHLAICPICKDELNVLMGFVDPNLIEKWIARLVSGSKPRNSFGMIPAFGIRGSESDAYHYEAGNANIAIEVQDDVKNPGRKVLRGLITGIGAKDYEVVLWREGQLIDTAKIDELENFVIRNLEPGDYELFIRGPHLEIQVQTFTI